MLPTFTKNFLKGNVPLQKSHLTHYDEIPFFYDNKSLNFSRAPRGREAVGPSSLVSTYVVEATFRNFRNSAVIPPYYVIPLKL